MDIEGTLNKWYALKEKLNEIEKECKKYRDKIEKFMDEKGIHSLEKGEFSVKRTHYTRSTVGKKDLPKELWEKYSKRSDYYVYNLTKK